MYVYSYRWILSQIRTPSHTPSHSIFDFRRTSCTILSCYYRLGFLVEFRFLGAVLPFLQRCNFLVTFHLFSLARRIYSYTNRNNHVIREVHSKYKSPCVNLIPQKKTCACTDIITNRVVVFFGILGFVDVGDPNNFLHPVDALRVLPVIVFRNLLFVLPRLFGKLAT